MYQRMLALSNCPSYFQQVVSIHHITPLPRLIVPRAQIITSRPFAARTATTTAIHLSLLYSVSVVMSWSLCVVFSYILATLQQVAGSFDLCLRRTDINRLAVYDGGFAAVDAEESTTCSGSHPDVRDGKGVVYTKNVRERGGFSGLKKSRLGSGNDGGRRQKWKRRKKTGEILIHQVDVLRVNVDPSEGTSFL